MVTVYRHAKKIKNISRVSAAVYHEKLGIPYSEIWPEFFAEEKKSPRK